ncbi:MAG: radical SAM protein [Austwickia sp.]|nr:radical SAM protein [Austwickia sp.]
MTSSPAKGAEFAELSVLTGMAHARLDGGSMDCGSGLLLLLTRRIRDVPPGQSLLVRTQDATVPADLLDWTRLAGHELLAQTDRDPSGAWHVLVRRGTSRDAPHATRSPATAAPFTSGEATPVGHRLWLYTNFHCNLSCGYCCAQSSPSVAPRELPVELAAGVMQEFDGLGGEEVFLTGGEPFLHPRLGDLGAEVGRRTPVTILTNAMVMERGSRRAQLEAMDRDRVRLQISLDSAQPQLHDQQRGAGSHARAVRGIRSALELGFRVRIAATWYDDQPDEGERWQALLDEWAIPAADRLVRPVARQGFAEAGQPVTVDTLAPEPTVTVDGIWWHPVAVSDPAMRVSDHPMPLEAALDTIREAVAVQDAARREGRRHVFRCA